jgi:hypothetical protein
MRRTMLFLGTLGLAAALLVPFAPTGAQDGLPTPAGHLGGRVPLGTEAPAAGEPASTPTPGAGGLVGAWLIRLGDAAAPVRVEFGADGTVRQEVMPDSADAATAHGGWAAMGTTAAFSTVQLQVGPAGYRGTVLLSGTLSLGPDGATVAGTFTELTVDAAGGVIGQAHGELSGSRA